MKDLHLLSIPLFENKRAETITKLILSLLTELDNAWRTKLLGITTDGENLMLGHINGVQKKIADEAEEELIHNWCLLHQIDLVMKKAYQVFADKFSGIHFIDQLKSLVTHLRQTNNAIMLKWKCPRFVETRWSGLYFVVTALKKKFS